MNISSISSSCLSHSLSRLPQRVFFNRRWANNVDPRFFFTSTQRATALDSSSSPKTGTGRRSKVKKDGEYSLRRRDVKGDQKRPQDGSLSGKEDKPWKARLKRPFPLANKQDIDRPKSASPQPQPPTDEKDPKTSPSRKEREHWAIDKDALRQKFGGDGWQPRKKISPDTMEVIRSLHEGEPEKYTTPVLANQFEISPEAIRRILKSKWKASPEKMEERRARWARRHDRIWDSKAELGLRPARTTDRKAEDNESQDQIMSFVTRPNL